MKKILILICFCLFIAACSKKDKNKNHEKAETAAQKQTNQIKDITTDCIAMSDNLSKCQPAACKQTVTLFDEELVSVHFSQTDNDGSCIYRQTVGSNEVQEQTAVCRFTKQEAANAGKALKEHFEYLENNEKQKPSDPLQYYVEKKICTLNI